MSATPLALLLTTAAATAVGIAALCAVHGLRKQIAALHTELAARRTPDPRALVPAARTGAEPDEIRTAVAEALADEREREMAEARAFWAAQEAHDSSDAPSLLGLPTDELYLPRQGDFVGLEHLGIEPTALEHLSLEQLGLDHLAAEQPLEALAETAEADEYAADSAELAAARRRHPSHPDFVPVQSPVTGNDHERTVACLEGLADARTALADVRPGPLGTLDVYVFEDGTTLCMTPGHRETAEQLAEALRQGESPVLLGGSGVSGAYALTFACGSDNVYILADRVIASP